MDPLARYRDLRLSLADVLRGQLHLARARHDPVMEEAVRGLLARLARDVFTVAVAGQFSRGKTTLLNALLGVEYLPTGALPLTSVLTRVGYGSVPGASYRRRGSEVELAAAVDEVPALIARQSARRAELQVTSVDIRLPAELLRLGVTFVDTPGVGGMDAATSAITLGFLPDADAVVFVTSADSALNETDLALLRRVPAGLRVFCVVNKCDLVTAEEADAVVAAARALLAEQRSAGAEVFALSALRGLRAARSLDPAADDGGIAAFRRALTAFLTASRAPIALANVRDRAEELARRQHALLALADRHATADADERAALTTAIAAAAETSEREAAIARVRTRLGERLTQWRDDTSWYREVPELLGGNGEDLDAWLAAHSGRITEDAVRAATPELPLLAATATAPLEAALRWASGDARPDASTETPWEPASLPVVAAPHMELPPATDAPAGWRPGRDRRAAARHEEETRRFADAFRERMAVQVDHWVQALDREAQRRAGDEAARLKAYLAAGAAPADTDAIARVRTRLGRIDGELSAAVAEAAEGAASGRVPGPSAAPAPTTGAAAAVEGHRELRCVVCMRQRDALVADLAERQFGLATREADQDALARTHGLCPTHTWSYATMTSPLGISAAYAPVAQSAADVLRAGETAAVPDPAMELATGSRSCPVCDVVARAERAAIDELTGVELVCVRHLARAAEAGCDRAIVGSLARRLADALEREAQDMRAYALKREALARGLLTAEEGRAHRETLLLLAGDPALAGPLVNEQERDEAGF